MMKRLLALLTTLCFLPFRPRLSRVLELVNAARGSLDLPRIESLPAGRTGRSTACPLAAALEGVVGADGICYKERYKALDVAQAWNTKVYHRGRQKYVVDLPDTLRFFVRDYDLGAYHRLAR